MTALTAVLALLPIVIGGNKSRQEIEYPLVTIVILDGLTTSTIFNLFICHCSIGNLVRARVIPAKQKKMSKPKSIKFYGAILLFLISLVIFSLLAHEVVIENEDWFDTRVFVFLQPWSTPSSIHFFKGLTVIGSTNFLLSAYVIVVIVLLYKKKRLYALDIGMLGIISTSLMYVLKFLFARSRPAFPNSTVLDTYSFPSGHSFCSLVFFTILICLVWKTKISKGWKWLLTIAMLLLVLAIGISRIVLRYHYASDVIGGFSVGIATLAIFFYWRRNLLNISS
jgi:undecaprenyl-diphosphatase